MSNNNTILLICICICIHTYNYSLNMQMYGTWGFVKYAYMHTYDGTYENEYFGAGNVNKIYKSMHLLKSKHIKFVKLEILKECTYTSTYENVCMCICWFVIFRCCWHDNLLPCTFMILRFCISNEVWCIYICTLWIVFIIFFYHWTLETSGDQMI